MGDTPIPSFLGTTVTGSISNIFKDLVLIKATGKLSPGNETSFSLNWSSYRYFVLGLLNSDKGSTQTFYMPFVFNTQFLTLSECNTVSTGLNIGSAIRILGCRKSSDTQCLLFSATASNSDLYGILMGVLN